MFFYELQFQTSTNLVQDIDPVFFSPFSTPPPLHLHLSNAVYSKRVGPFTKHVFLFQTFWDEEKTLLNLSPSPSLSLSLSACTHKKKERERERERECPRFFFILLKSSAKNIFFLNPIELTKEIL